MCAAVAVGYCGDSVVMWYAGSMQTAVKEVANRFEKKAMEIRFSRSIERPLAIELSHLLR
jgi:hypothetical protein